jgi:hypothetical protein
MARRNKNVDVQRDMSTTLRPIRRQGASVVAFVRHAARQHPTPPLPQEKNPLQFDCTQKLDGKTPYVIVRAHLCQTLRCADAWNTD